jgi:hypothetical protein
MCRKHFRPFAPCFTLFIYPPPPTSILPLKWLVLHSCPSLFKHLFIAQWSFYLGILPVNRQYVNQSNPVCCCSLPYPPYATLFNSFQCTLVCLVIMYFNVNYSLSFSSSFPPSLVSSYSPTIGNMFWCLYLSLYLSSTYQRKHATFVILNLTSFNMMFSGSMHLSMRTKFHSS